MFSCCSSKRREKVTSDDVDNAPYGPMVVKTSVGDGFSLQTKKLEENQTLVTQTHLREGEQQQPMTHTVVKTKKSGNTVTVVKTTTSYSQVVKTESDDEHRVTSDNDERVYKTTVIRSPTPKRKRFNLKSVLDRRVKRQISFREQDEQFHHQCLFAHNRYRLKHGLKPLVLNKEMCKYATEWANHLAKKNIVQYRQKCKYGENLGLATGGAYTAEDAVKSWYDEIESYDFERPGLSSRTDHFTQIVWKETTQLGVGVAQKDNRTWIVCNYDPPGNILNCYKDNVIAPKGGVVTKQSKLTAAISDKARIEGGQEEVVPSTSQGVKRVENYQNSKFSKFEIDCLEAHNGFRKIHGCKPMKLSKDLCNLATDWARHLAKIRCMHHRPHNDYGENIFQSINYDSTAADAVKSWYDEINNYKYSKPGFSSNTGHFTQIVWSDSMELGVGKAKVDNLTFIVCNYNPPGNVMTHYKSQVPPIGGFKDQMENGTEVDGKSQMPVNGVRISLKPNNFFSAKWSKWTKRK